MIGLDARVQTKQCWRPGDLDHVGLTKARVEFPEKGTTPESGGGTASMSRAVVTAATLASLPISATPTPVQKRTGTPKQSHRSRSSACASPLWPSHPQ